MVITNWNNHTRKRDWTILFKSVNGDEQDGISKAARCDAVGGSERESPMLSKSSSQLCEQDQFEKPSHLRDKSVVSRPFVLEPLGSTGQAEVVLPTSAALSRSNGAEIKPEAERQGSIAFEKHCSVAELSRQWGFSENTIRRLFRKEPGVIKIVHQETLHKRRYTSMRIPERIAQRVHRRLQGLA